MVLLTVPGPLDDVSVVVLVAPEVNVVVYDPDEKLSVAVSVLVPVETAVTAVVTPWFVAVVVTVERSFVMIVWDVLPVEWV
jgi:hypothetical protein